MNKYFAPEADVLKISIDAEVCGVSQNLPGLDPEDPGVNDEI